MSETRDKARGVFLAALMVLSVFAGAVAFTGGAAAQEVTDATRTIDSTEAQPGETIEVTVDVSISEDSGVQIVEDVPSELNPEIVEGLSNIDNVQDDGTVTFNSLGGSSSYTATYSVTIPSDAAAGTTYDISGSAEASTSQDVTGDSEIVVVDGDDGDNGDDGDSPNYDAIDRNNLDGLVIFQGQEINVSGFDAGERVQLRSGDTESSTFEEYVNANDDGIVTIDTDELGDDASQYLIRAADGQDYGPFEVGVQDVSFAFDDETVRQGMSTTLDFIDDNRGETVDLIVSADNLDAEELADVLEGASVESKEDGTVQITDQSEDASLTADFSDVATGDYEFTVSVEDTTAEDTASITVEDPVPADATIDNVVDDERGDVTEISVAVSGTDSATLQVGSEDAGYVANVSVTDGNNDGEVTVLWNTFLADSLGEDEFSVANSDDEVTNVDVDTRVAGGNGHIIAANAYELAVAPGDDSADVASQPSDLGSVTVMTRSTDALTTWTAPSSTSVSSLEDLSEAIDEGTITEDATIATGDLVVTEIEASGLEGAFSQYMNDGQTATEAFDNLVANDDLSLTHTEVVGASSNRLPLEVSAGSNDAVTVIADSEEDSYYVIHDTDDLDLPADTEFTTEFTLESKNVNSANFGLVAPTEDGEFVDQTLEEDFETVERTAGVDSESAQVSQADGQTITGTSSLASGSQLNVRIQSDRGANSQFVIGPRVVTVEDGAWSLDADFSDYETGTEFTVTVRERGSTSTSDSADGNIAESTANFQVSDLDPATASVTEGDTVDVFATVSNDGDAEGTQTVELRVGGNEVSSENVTLDAGEETTVEFSADTSGLDSGTFTHGVYTNDSSQEGTLTVAGVPDFDVSDLSPQTANLDEPGAVIDVSATVTNDGNVEATKDVELRIDGQTLATESVTLAGGESTTVTFEADTSALEFGTTYVHSIATADSDSSGALTIGPEPTSTATPEPTPTATPEPTPTATPEPTPTATPEETATSTPDDSDGDGAGFGVVVALLAFLGAALLAVRRQTRE